VVMTAGSNPSTSCKASHHVTLSVTLGD
jgi:hypothetical protein